MSFFRTSESLDGPLQDPTLATYGLVDLVSEISSSRSPAGSIGSRPEARRQVAKRRVVMHQLAAPAGSHQANKKVQARHVSGFDLFHGSLGLMSLEVASRSRFTWGRRDVKAAEQAEREGTDGVGPDQRNRQEMPRWGEHPTFPYFSRFSPVRDRGEGCFFPPIKMFKAREESAVHIQRVFRGGQGGRVVVEVVDGGDVRKHPTIQKAFFDIVEKKPPASLICWEAQGDSKVTGQGSREVGTGSTDLGATARCDRDRYNQQMEQYKAATKLWGCPYSAKRQSMARRDAAIKKAFPHARNGQWVDQIRAAKFEKMNKAATFIRKMWLGARTRYLELMEEFGRHVQKVVTIQRYARGFLVRLRMWRQAVRAEEELWAALEIQRVWMTNELLACNEYVRRNEWRRQEETNDVCGYLGRVKWETKYEEVLIQRHIRGWLARTKVGRIRRQIARAEFERARRRFRAAQRVQAMLRGALVRKKFARRFWCCRHAAVNIQRVVRGHALRKRVWQQVKEQKATTIQAHIQGWLVRRRKLHLIAKVICIQRGWRSWQRKPLELREAALAQRKERKEQAEKIQQAFRKHAEHQEVKRIQATDAGSSS
ncbi:Unconventional myosin-Va (Dilute myosin heavy chain [Durusdinium trenchii]|uniref:Non-muscle (Myosin heavy chain p190 (Myosin-V n=1 Tax=Durusdinium trenchii TaxID=1381693 RepID=A0ABP0SGA4_9DINO